MLRQTKENFMTANVGTIDRILRIVVGLVLIAMVFVGPQTPWAGSASFRCSPRSSASARPIS